MTREDAIRRLLEHEAELKRLGVQQLFLFGSTARDEAKDGSDVDLFFDHERGSMGLFQLMDVRDRTADILGHKVDLLTREGIHPRLRDRIEASAVRVF